MRPATVSSGRCNTPQDQGHPASRVFLHTPGTAPRCLPAQTASRGEDGTAMTDLLSRPSTSRPPPTSVEVVSAVPQAADHVGGSRTASPRGGAALAAVATTLASLVLCMGVAVVGWFLADAGAHGQTTDALRVGADAWLVGHGAGITLAGVPLHVVPPDPDRPLRHDRLAHRRWGAASAAPEDGRVRRARRHGARRHLPGGHRRHLHRRGHRRRHARAGPRDPGLAGGRRLAGGGWRSPRPPATSRPGPSASPAGSAPWRTPPARPC